ncbi:hypothetical protein AGMMS50212_17240 [Spirochaetia bacterium]|nr:hypothetical protein AGMMS50212_17240 [Spirochaetia bacterium]
MVDCLNLANIKDVHMNLFFLPLLLGGGQDAGVPKTGMEQVMSFLPFILIIGIFYFLIIRPQNKKQKETKKMLEAIKKGDKIITIGGVHGTIHSVKDSSVIVKVDDNVKMEFTRGAIASVVTVAKEEKETQIEDKSETSE